MSDDEAAPFRRTPEQIQRDRERLEREVAAEKARDKLFGAPAAPIQRERVGGDLNEVCSRALERARDIEGQRRRLPCFQAAADGDDEGAIDACDAAAAHSTCEWRSIYEACPRLRQPDVYGDTLKRLGADSGVESQETGPLLAAARREGRVQLLDTDALQLVRAVLQRRRVSVPMSNGAEVDQAGGVTAGKVLLTGTEALLVLGGNQGRGKTLAACYAIARLGGMYTRTPAWTRRGGVDYDRALSAKVLVVDQLGREDWGSSDWLRSQFEDIVDARYQRRRLTILVGNLSWEAFVDHFERHLNRSTLRDRVFGNGVFVLFGGDSLRAPLRAQQLRLVSP